MTSSRKSSKKSAPIARCNAEQARALLAYAAEKGINWKHDLAADWMRAARPGALQQVRNGFGPHWLASVTIADLETFAAS